MRPFVARICYFLGCSLLLVNSGCKDTYAPPCLGCQPEMRPQVFLPGIASVNKDDNYNNIRYYINDKSVTLKKTIDNAGVPWEYTMNILGNDTVIFIHGYTYSSMTHAYMALRNGVQYSVVDNTPNAMVYSVYVNGSDIYAVGQYKDANNRLKACYWKNSLTKVDLPCDKDACAFKMTVAGDNVYVTGSYSTGEYSGIPCYWKDGVRTDLPVSGANTEDTFYRWNAHSIIVEYGNIFVSGKVTKTLYTESSRRSSEELCYWKNGTLSMIENATQLGLVPLTVYQGTMYIPGGYLTNPEIDDPSDLIYKACYFEDGKKMELASAKETMEVAGSIFFLGNVMYVTGFNMTNTGTSTLWINNEQTILDSDFVAIGQMFVK